MISGLTGFGMFVQLDNMIEGLVHVNDLDGYYTYNEELQVLINNKTKDNYTLGDRLLVQVKAASKENQTIDFELVKRM
jgi:ribonuclease R